MLNPQSLATRQLAASGVELTCLGFGSAAIGNLYAAMSDAQAEAAVSEALASGVAYFDTAPHYGFGLSERRLGLALACRNNVTLSTKVGRRLEPISPADAAQERHGFVDADPYEPIFDYSYDGIMRSFETSCQRLGREKIDILLAHDLGRATHGDGHSEHLKTFLNGGYRAMQSLKAQGAVSALGLGVNEWQVCEEVLAHADVDVFLLAGRYTLLEQTALDSFLPICAQRGVSIILGGPFNSGILIEGVNGARIPHYNYAPAPPEIIDRVRRIEAVCAAHSVPLAAAALQFPLAHPCVVSVIPGMASPEQVKRSLILKAIAIPDALWEELKAERLLHELAPAPAPLPILAV